MISIEMLTEYGADTKEGIARCMGMEEFYLQLVETIPDDEKFAVLEAALSAGDASAAFAAAHSLRGALENLELRPLAEPVAEMTERLRGADEMPDLSDLMPAYREALAGLRALSE